MRAMVWHGDQRLDLEDLPEPAPARDEVVVEIEVAGICGSDLHAYKGHPGPRVPPLVLGHEVVGKVADSTVVIYPLVGCGHCAACRAGNDNLCLSWRLVGMHRPGVFAEKVSVPQRCLFPLPVGMEAERAVLTEPLACCVGALASQEVGPESELLVLGCGPIGLLTIFLAAQKGASVNALDPLPERQQIALRMGAARVASAADDLGDGLFDLAVDAAGFASTWQSGISSLRNGGTMIMLGLGQAEGSFPMAVVVRRALTLRGQFAYSRADFASALEVLASAPLPTDWVTEAPLSGGPAAFADLVERPSDFTKVLLRP